MVKYGQINPHWLGFFTCCTTAATIQMWQESACTGTVTITSAGMAQLWPEGLYCCYGCCCRSPPSHLNHQWFHQSAEWRGRWTVPKPLGCEMTQKVPQEGRGSSPEGFRSWLDRSVTTLMQCWWEVPPEVPPTRAAMGYHNQELFCNAQVSSGLWKW